MVQVTKDIKLPMKNEKGWTVYVYLLKNLLKV